MTHAPNTTVEHQAGGCRLCSVSLEDIQVAYLLCADCQRLARAAPALLAALKGLFTIIGEIEFDDWTNKADIEAQLDLAHIAIQAAKGDA